MLGFRVSKLALGPLFAAVLFVAARGEADASRAQTVAVTPIDGELGSELRFAIEDELGRVADVRVVPEARASFRLRGMVPSFATTAVGSNERIACSVSVLVEDRRSGAMRAVLEGRARSEGPRGSVERDALLRAAVHGALRSIGATLVAR